MKERLEGFLLFHIQERLLWSSFKECLQIVQGGKKKKTPFIFPPGHILTSRTMQESLSYCGAGEDS